MDYFVIPFLLAVNLVFLFLGIRTQSMLAHFFSILVGFMLLGQALAENVLMVAWVSILLVVYPIVQLDVLRRMNVMKRRNGKK